MHHLLSMHTSFLDYFTQFYGSSHNTIPMIDNSQVSMYSPSISSEFQKTYSTSPFECLVGVIYIELLISLHMPHPRQEFWVSVKGISMYPVCQVEALESVSALVFRSHALS